MGDTAQVGYLALAKQSAWGVPAQPTAYASQQLLHNSHSIGLETEVNDPDPEIGGQRDPRVGAATYGGAKISGSIEAAQRYTLLPLFLLAAGFTESGAPVEQGAGTGAYRHRFVYGDATPLTMESGWGKNRLARQWSDCLVDTLAMWTEADGDTLFSADILGRSELVVTPSVTAAPALEGKGTWYGCAVTFNSLATYQWTSAKLELSNNLDDSSWRLGTRQLGDLTPGERALVLTGDIDLGSNDPDVTALHRAAMYGDPTATGPGLLDPYTCSGAVTFGSTKKIGTSATERYRAVATVPTFVLKPLPLEQQGADKLKVSLEARAYGSDVTIDVFNARSTAY